MFSLIDEYTISGNLPPKRQQVETIECQIIEINTMQFNTYNLAYHLTYHLAYQIHHQAYYYQELF